jgi:HNH endonuclease
MSIDGRNSTNWGGPRPNSGKKPVRVKVTCLVCKKEFEVPILQKEQRKYCGRACYLSTVKGRVRPSMRIPDMKAHILARIRVTDAGCWEWLKGKGWMGYGKTRHNSRTRPVHLVTYELFVGPIPEGKQLDHLCKNVICCNPAHLEPVTPRENVLRSDNFCAKNARKTHCIHGHEFTQENTYLSYRPVANPEAGRRRYCRICRTEEARRRRRRQKEKVITHE